MSANGWKSKDVLKVIGYAFTVGFIYASLTFQIHGLTRYISILDSRVDHIEQWLTKQSHGQFMREDLPAKDSPE